MLLHYKSFGEGDPLLILHGFLGSLDNWQSIAKELAANYQVFILDVRNHGKSFHDNKHDYASLVEDLHFLVNHLGFSKINLLGHSMGGKIAMLFALKYPHLVTKLIVVDIAPKIYPPGHEDILQALSKVNPKELKSRQEAVDIISTYIHEPSVVPFLLKNLDREAYGSFSWKMNLPVLSSQYAEILLFPGEGIFDAPTLFLKGEKSDYILPSDEPIIRQYFPNAKIVSIKNAGHWVHAENPVDFISETSNLLRCP
jgi:pimeloyl-ACP methyl ester carboxylesterase